MKGRGIELSLPCVFPEVPLQPPWQCWAATLLLLNVYEEAAVNSHIRLRVAWEWSLLGFRTYFWKAVCLTLQEGCKYLVEEDFKRLWRLFSSLSGISWWLCEWILWTIACITVLVQVESLSPDTSNENGWKSVNCQLTQEIMLPQASAPHHGGACAAMEQSSTCSGGG